MKLWTRLDFPSTFERARAVEEQILADCRQAGFDEEDRFAVKMGLHEALVNAVKHGNEMDASKRVRVRYHVDSRRLDVTVEDDGPGFNLQAVPDPTAEENLAAPSGRGILLMRAYMDSVQFNAAGNAVSMTKTSRPEA